MIAILMRLRTPCFCFQTAQKSDALKGAICKALGSVCGSSNTAATLIIKQKRPWLQLEETQKGSEADGFGGEWNLSPGLVRCSLLNFLILPLEKVTLILCKAT